MVFDLSLGTPVQCRKHLGSLLYASLRFSYLCASLVARRCQLSLPSLGILCSQVLCLRASNQSLFEPRLSGTEQLRQLRPASFSGLQLLPSLVVASGALELHVLQLCLQFCQ
jgi:hypothetical protein